MWEGRGISVDASVEEKGAAVRSLIGVLQRRIGGPVEFQT